MSAHDDVRVSQDAAAAAAAAPPPPPPPPSAPPPPLLSSSSSSPVSVLQNPSADEAAVARCVAATPCMPSTQQLRGRHGIQLVVHSCPQRSRRCACSSGLRQRSRSHCIRARTWAPLVEVSAAAAPLHAERSGIIVAARRAIVRGHVPRCIEARLVR